MSQFPSETLRQPKTLHPQLHQLHVKVKLVWKAQSCRSRQPAQSFLLLFPLPFISLLCMCGSVWTGSAWPLGATEDLGPGLACGIRLFLPQVEPFITHTVITAALWRITIATSVTACVLAGFLCLSQFVFHVQLVCF